MKKAILAILLAFILMQPSMAANSASSQTQQKIKLGGRGNVSKITPVLVTFDTTASDLTVYTPASNNMACLVGMFFSGSSASDLTIKSASTTLVVLKLSANQGVLESVNNGAILCTQPGEALKLQVSVVINSMLLYIAETEYLDFSY